jgi:hypothetical protein
VEKEGLKLLAFFASAKIKHNTAPCVLENIIITLYYMQPSLDIFKNCDEKSSFVCDT